MSKSISNINLIYAISFLVVNRKSLTVNLLLFDFILRVNDIVVAFFLVFFG